MNIFGRTQILSQYSYPETLKIFSKLGYDGAEISLLNKDFKIREEFFNKNSIKNNLLPQKGDMDLKSYVNKLKEIGFNGSLPLDLYKYDYEKASRSALEYLKKLIH